MTEVCKICKREEKEFRSGVTTDSRYISRRCFVCFGKAKLDRQNTTGNARYERERDLEDNRKDVLQPHLGGKPNREFIVAYRKEAEDYFSQEELARYE